MVVLVFVPYPFARSYLHSLCDSFAGRQQSTHLHVHVHAHSPPFRHSSRSELSSYSRTFLPAAYIRIDPHPTAVITVINSDTHTHRPHLLCFGCRWSAGPQFRCHSWPPPLPTMWPCDFRPGRWLKEALTQVVGAAVTLPLTPRWVERPTKTD